MHEYTDRPLARWTILGRRPTMGNPLGNRAPTRLIGRCPIPRWSSGYRSVVGDKGMAGLEITNQTRDSVNR